MDWTGLIRRYGWRKSMDEWIDEMEWDGMAESERYRHRQTTRMKETIMMIQSGVVLIRDEWSENLNCKRVTIK